MNITPKRKELLDLIEKEPELNFYEIADRLGIKVGAVYGRLVPLLESGTVRREPARWVVEKRV